MAIFSTNPTQDYSLPTTLSQNLGFDTEVTANATTYSWTSSAGDLVTLTGSFTYSGGNVFGTVDQIDVDLGNLGVVDFNFILPSVDIALLDYSNHFIFLSDILVGDDSFDVSVSTAFNTEYFGDGTSSAYNRLGGDDSFSGTITAGNHAIYGEFDQQNQVARGGDDTFEITVDASGTSQRFGGDVRIIYAGGLVGGDDTLEITFDAGNSLFVYGDVGIAYADVTGGDDILTETSQVINNSRAYGDTSAAAGAGDTIIGGQDTITGFTYSYGDTASHSSGYFYGGDDLIVTSTQSSTVYGDAHTLSAGMGDIFIAGADHITGGDGFDDLFGDIASIQSGASLTDITFGDDIIYGGAGEDIIWGDYEQDLAGVLTYNAGGNDALYGGDDDDTLYGNGGDDYLEGGDGADIHNGGDGTDTASYASSTVGVNVNLLTGFVSGGDAAGDTFVDIENLQGSDYDDVLDGNNDENSIYGGDGVDDISGRGDTDFLYGEGGDDELYGNSDDDILNGGEGADALDGGTGTDIASYATSSSAVTVNLSTGATSGGDAAGDTFVSIEGLQGSEHNDTLSGDSNDNFIAGEGGDDNLNGHGGTDTAFYFQSTAHLSFDHDLTTGIYTIGSASSGEDTLDNFELLNIDEQDYDLTSAPAFTSGGDVVTGTSGNDVMIALGGNDTVNGGDGLDILIGGIGTDSLYGEGDDDHLEGGGGADIIDGGAGFDIASYINANNSVDINLLSGTATGSHATGDVLTDIEGLSGGDSGDTLTGGNGRNDIWGGDGKDDIGGFKGDDFLYGGGGNDFMTGGDGADYIDGGDGVDILRYTGSNAAVTVDLGSTEAQFGGHAEGDIVLNIEKLFGSSYDDTLTGNEADNRIFGLSGDDMLTGGAGQDRLWGGDDADTFIFTKGDDRLYVMDFEDNIDTLDITGFGFVDIADALSHFDEIGSDTRFRDGEGNNIIIYDMSIADLTDDIVF